MKQPGRLHGKDSRPLFRPLSRNRITPAGDCPVTYEPERITSARNPRLKAAQKLRDRRHRQQQGRILIDGRREVQRALLGHVQLLEVFVAEERLQQPDWASWLQQLGQQPLRLIALPEHLLAKISYGDRREGIVAVAQMPRRSLADLRLPSRPLLAVLEGIEKPGNVGAIVRSADAAGVDAVIVADKGTDLFNPNAIRASLGTLFTCQVCAEPSQHVQQWLAELHAQVCVARLDASLRYDQVDYAGATAFVLGSEAQGVSSRWSPSPYLGIKLPMLGVADSLNVSAAAAVLFYEAQRQRRQDRALS